LRSLLMASTRMQKDAGLLQPTEARRVSVEDRLMLRLPVLSARQLPGYH
jgi:hypothetical protein